MSVQANPPIDLLIDVSRLEAAFYGGKPDPADPNQLVSFGTSGHRGTSSNATFTETHICHYTTQIFIENVPQERARGAIPSASVLSQNGMKQLDIERRMIGLPDRV
jgi:hypothetical protein